MENKNTNTENTNAENKNKKTGIRIAAIIAIIILILLCLIKCNGNPRPTPDNVIDTEQTGDVTVGGKKDLPPAEQVKPASEVKYINFSGYGKVKISERSPEIELSNPEGNEAAFVFTVRDKDTGDLIAKTGAVNPSEYAYVNVYDYYKTTGNFFIEINVDTFGSDGTQMNGVVQETEVEIVE